MFASFLVFLVLLVRLFNFITPSARLPEIGDGREHCGVELTWILEWSEMTDSRQKQVPRIWEAVSQILRMFALDEFIVFGLSDDDRNANSSQIVRRIIRLG